MRPRILHRVGLALGFGLLALAALLARLNAPPAAHPEQGFRFRVERGEAIRPLARRLEQAGLIRSAGFFVLCAKAVPGSTPKPGVYEVAPTATASAIWRQLRRGPPPARITLPEGWTAWQMAQRLQERGIARADPFLALVEGENLEGRLFPDTYAFAQDSSPRQVIDRLAARFAEQKPEDWESSARALGLSPEHLLILASIVQREAKAPEELPLIAGVFLNRLKKGWLLESCATVQHALSLARGTPGVWQPRLYYKDLEISSPYNTYKKRGLPPAPIGNPGRAALEAAARPAKTDAMFFAADGEGTHRFSRYYKDHLGAKPRERNGTP